MAHSACSFCSDVIEGTPYRRTVSTWYLKYEAIFCEKACYIGWLTLAKVDERLQDYELRRD